MPNVTRAVVALLAVTALVALAGACSSDGSSSAAPTSASTPAFADTDLAPLHAEGGAHPRIVDDQDRHVLLRGVNLNTLGDYYQGDPDLAPTFPYDDADFAEMATLGFDVVRLIVSWSALEPRPGEIDDGYLDRIHHAVDAAAAQGLYTVIDMHQDAWGKFVATPDATTCPAGLQPALGWDGAPEWATHTDARSTCNNDGSRETAGAVIAAWNNFYDDTGGIRGEFLDTWERLAQSFAADAAVAGYDVLNEPGFGPGLAGTNEALSSLYAHAVEAIRAGEAAADESRPHLVFFEPAVLWSGLGDGAGPVRTTDDANLVFAPHLYAESITSTDITIAEGFAAAAAKAAQYGTTFWAGEYGWFGDPDEQAGLVETYAQQEDAYLVGGAWWQWRQACGDPHSLGAPAGGPPAELVHLHRTACPSGDDLGLTQPWATTLSRTYPRAAPGRLTRLSSDPRTQDAQIEGRAGTGGGGTLELWVPDRGDGTPAVTGGTDTADIHLGAGGYQVSVPVQGAYVVSIRSH